MAGTIPLSMTTQFDIYGKPLSGGRLYGIQAGSVSTPQNFYQDLALSIAWPNPIILDAGGRIPQLLCADGEIKIRLEDKNGVVQLSADHVLVIGPSSGGGGGSSTVDATTVAQTGDMKVRYGVGIHPGVTPGWVRANGLTIGSAGSSASERANADCEALFKHLWGVDTALVLSPPRGGSAAADWTANKQLFLPDGRTRLLMGLADMGNAYNGGLAGIPFDKGNVVTLGSLFGHATHTMTDNELRAHRHSVVLSDSGHSHGFTAGSFGAPTQGIQSGGTFNIHFGDNAALTTNLAGTGMGIHDGSGQANATSAVGNTQPFDITNPAMLVTFYLKL